MPAGYPAPLTQWFELANWTFNLAAGVLIAIGLVQVLLARRKVGEDSRLTTTLVGFDLLIDSIAFQIAAVLPAAGLLVIAVPATWIVLWTSHSIRAITTETSVVIDRDQASVFAFVANDANQPRYLSMVESVEKITSGPIGPGTQSRARVRVGPNRVWEGIGEVVEYEPNSRIKSRVIGRTPNLEVVTFEPAPGGTLLKHRFESEINYNSALFGTVFLRDAQRQRILKMRNEGWAKLKQILESSEFDC